jgi:hypothetical protein
MKHETESATPPEAGPAPAVTALKFTQLLADAGKDPQTLKEVEDFRRRARTIDVEALFRSFNR